MQSRREAKLYFFTVQYCIEYIAGGYLVVYIELLQYLCTLGCIVHSGYTYTLHITQHGSLKKPLRRQRPTFSGVALDHLTVGLKTGLGDDVHGELLVEGSLGGHQGGVGDQGVVDPEPQGQQGGAPLFCKLSL